MTVFNSMTILCSLKILSESIQGYVICFAHYSIHLIQKGLRQSTHLSTSF